MPELLLLRHGMTGGNRLKRYIGVTDEPLCEEGILALREKGKAVFGTGREYPGQSEYTPKDSGQSDRNKIWSESQNNRPEAVFVSPLLRCRQTAEIYFPDMPQQVIPELAECNFGDFENKNYLELSGNPDYQAWIDSGGTLPFPHGESREQVRGRNLAGMKHVLKICASTQIRKAALVIHGGTIMNLMEACGRPERSFYDWHAENGCGYLVRADVSGPFPVLNYIRDL